MTGKHGVNDNGRADQWKRDESKANLGAGEILGRDCAKLCPDRSAGVHHQRNQNINIAFDGVGKGAVAGGDDDFEKIGADGKMGWNSEDIDHRGHTDVAGTAAKKSAA